MVRCDGDARLRIAMRAAIMPSAMRLGILSSLEPQATPRHFPASALTRLDQSVSISVVTSDGSVSSISLAMRS